MRLVLPLGEHHHRHHATSPRSVGGVWRKKKNKKKKFDRLWRPMPVTHVGETWHGGDESEGTQRSRDIFASTFQFVISQMSEARTVTARPRHRRIPTDAIINPWNALRARVCPPWLFIKPDSCVTLHIGLKLEARIGLPLWAHHSWKSDGESDLTCFNQKCFVFTFSERLMQEIKNAWFRCSQMSRQMLFLRIDIGTSIAADIFFLIPVHLGLRLYFQPLSCPHCSSTREATFMSTCLIVQSYI